MSNQNIESTKKGYAAFNAGDLETALSVFDDAGSGPSPVKARSLGPTAARLK